MLQWLNNKYPEFWKKYISSFKEKSDRYVVLSIESTGLNTSKDVILAISAVTETNAASYLFLIGFRAAKISP